MRTIFQSLVSLAVFATSAVATDNPNATRIEDWDTLLLLTRTRLGDVAIDADSPEALVGQLHALVRDQEEAEDLRFRFDLSEWEIELSDGAIGKAEFKGSLKLDSTDLLTLVRLLCEAGLMTFDVKENEIVFRPRYC